MAINCTTVAKRQTTPFGQIKSIKIVRMNIKRISVIKPMVNKNLRPNFQTKKNYANNRNGRGVGSRPTEIPRCENWTKSLTKPETS